MASKVGPLVYEDMRSDLGAILVGDFSRGETSIEVLHLKPNRYYSIRTLATNSANLTTLSPAIRVQTREAASDAEDEGELDMSASIRTSVFPFGTQAPEGFARENGLLEQPVVKIPLARRNTSTGRFGDGTTYQAPPSSESDDEDTPHVIYRLTERLESLKKQKDEVDRQIEDEEVEAKINHVELARERDRLKQELRLKEEGSAELRRHGNHLDKLNRAAQSKRVAKEKLLQQKKADKQRLKDDCETWEGDIIEIRNSIEQMDTELKSVVLTRNQELAMVRLGIVEDQDIIKSLEEEIRIKGVQIKEQEQQREHMHVEVGGEQECAKTDNEKDEAWEARYQDIQAKLGSIWHALQQSTAEEQGAEEHLSWWLARRARNPEQFLPILGVDLPQPVQCTSSRRNRQTNSRDSDLSNPGYYSSSTGYRGASSPYSLGSSLYLVGNGTTAANGADQNNPSQNEKILIEGAAISPAANDLLPSNLFRDEDTLSPVAAGKTTGVDHFLGHAVSNSDASARGPHTPVSASSRGGSVFTSPYESMQNLPGHLPDSDRQSINSTNAPIPASLTVGPSPPQPLNRFANLFSSPFGRQRGKPTAQEPPLLGTLEQGESESFPRGLEQDTFDDLGERRRWGSHGTWSKPMAGLLTRNSGAFGDGLIRARTGSGRTSRLNVFKPRMDPLDPNAISQNERSSPRPSSTYSFELPFGRPSNDGQRIWGSFPDSIPSRNSPLGSQWASSHGPWSKVPSRRSSLQLGSTTNLSIGSTPLDAEGLPGSLSKYRSEQAPIGTRPMAQRTKTPKLNPAAPSFKTLFSRSEAKKTAKIDKLSGKHPDTPKETDSEKGGTEGNESVEDASPSNSRLSRDAQSVYTATSTAGSFDSFERTTSGAASDATTPSGPKESLMQKISRKSSSSKFNVPWSKDRGIFSKRAGEPSTPGEIDEDSFSEGQLGKSADSAMGALHTPQDKSGRTWPGKKRKSRKGDFAEKCSELGDENES